MQGTHTAIITPFLNGKVDYESLHRMIEQQIDAGIDGIVPCGTTGESPTLSHIEHNEIVRFVKEKVAGRVLVIAGTGSNSTAECISFSKKAEATGVDALLIVSPYYNKPTQEGIFNHYKTIAESVGVEIIVYHIPGRTSSSIEVNTFMRMAEINNITSIKEATGSIDFANELMVKLPHMHLLSGNDSLNFPLYACGAHGCISVVSNAYPAEVKRIKTYVDNNENKKALELHQAFWNIGTTMFIESNPIPIKEACKQMGLISSNEVRSPLINCSKATSEVLQQQTKLLKTTINKLAKDTSN